MGPFVVMIGTTTPLNHAFDIDSLASQIAGVLALAGSRAQAGTTWGRDDRPMGVWVSSREGDNGAASAADILIAELNKDGIVAHKEPKPFAGPKPSPPPEPSPVPPSAHESPETAGREALAQLRMHTQQQQLWNQMPDIIVVVGTKP